MSTIRLGIRRECVAWFAWFREDFKHVTWCSFSLPAGLGAKLISLLIYLVMLYHLQNQRCKRKYATGLADCFARNKPPKWESRMNYAVHNLTSSHRVLCGLCESNTVFLYLCNTPWNILEL